MYIRGVTYGAFRPARDGNEYQDVEVLERDFELMAANGVNAVRIPHTTPPRHLLDVAQRHGLRVMVGLSAEQLIGYLIDRRKSLREIERLIRERARTCAGHPALLCYALGNEIPAPVARWYGSRRVERYLEALHAAVKHEDPEALVTYVNYPTTEYLELPFLDLVCYNVYLEQREPLEAYLARLQNIAQERPLILSEVGLDSLRNGEEAQAQSLDWQTRTAFASGCAGVFVFAWTDEWFRAGADVDDWEFGITDRQRRPKPALAAVRKAFAEVPFPPDIRWPRVSVVVCTHNGQRTIRDCLEGLRRVDYPDFEVIVVDDGSTDATTAIAAEYDVRLIRTENRGLSSARNTGFEAATGEIVAYLDDDAWPDPQWLQYLAAVFLRTDYAGVGGPNIAPPAGPIADCVANAPGGPVHVLLSDRVAEHIPGCNMAFRKSCLEAIGGFDPRFRVAGDDVDACWRLQEQGWTLGFAPAAMVWHHRRNSVRTYWRQQRGYGRAEALLKQKWPEKYNGTGHLTWAGRIYGKGLTQSLELRRGRIYHGTWGGAPFQRLYRSQPNTLYALALIPEWYVLIPILAVLSAVGVLWRPLLAALPLLGLALVVSVTQCALSAARASFATRPRSRLALWRLRLLTASLHLLHPLARLWGRRKYELLSWWPSTKHGLALPWPRTRAVWREEWLPTEVVLGAIETALHGAGAMVRRGGDWDSWDLEVTGGPLGAARLLTGMEDHGEGRQLFRFRWWPRWSVAGRTFAFLFGGLTLGAAFAAAWAAGAILGIFTAFLTLRASLESATAMAAIKRGIEAWA